VNFFQWLRGRGLDGVKLIVGGKCMGILACARLRYVAGTQWGNKKYMSMRHLEDGSIAG
jgi:hypothetical protein